MKKARTGEREPTETDDDKQPKPKETEDDKQPKPKETEDNKQPTPKETEDEKQTTGKRQLKTTKQDDDKEKKKKKKTDDKKQPKPKPKETGDEKQPKPKETDDKKQPKPKETGDEKQPKETGDKKQPKPKETGDDKQPKPKETGDNKQPKPKKTGDQKQADVTWSNLHEKAVCDGEISSEPFVKGDEVYVSFESGLEWRVPHLVPDDLKGEQKALPMIGQTKQKPKPKASPKPVPDFDLGCCRIKYASQGQKTPILKFEVRADRTGPCSIFQAENAGGAEARWLHCGAGHELPQNFRLCLRRHELVSGCCGLQGLQAIVA